MWTSYLFLAMALQPPPEDPYNAAVRLAAQDVAGVVDPTSARYVLLRKPGDWQHTHLAAVLAMNRNPNIIRPVRVGNLLRLDLRQFAADDKDYLKLLAFWETLDRGLKKEPYFTSYVSKVIEKRVKVKAIPYKAADGKTYDWKWGVERIRSKEAPIAAPYLSEAYTVLRRETSSRLPIVRSDWLISTLLTSVAGGRYYDAKRITGQNEDAFLKSLEAHPTKNINRALTLEAPTGLPRILEWRGTTGVRTNSASGIVFITRDIEVGNERDPELDLMQNIDSKKWAASEIIGLGPDGNQVFVLTDGQGKLQDKAPDTVVHDYTVPDDPSNPHVFTGQAILQTPISCLSCHGAQGGYLDFRNKMKGSRIRSLVVTDDTTKEESLQEKRDRLEAEFSGDEGKPLFRARQDVEQAVFRTTRGLTTSTAYKRIVADFVRYEWEYITPAIALQDLGLDLPANFANMDEAAQEEEAMQLFSEAVPKLPADPLTGVQVEHAYIGFLREGERIRRGQWERVFADTMLRVKLRVKP